MTESSDTQQFKINAMHGRDAGVWVCEGSGLGLGPALFLRALCPNSDPRPLLVKWKPGSNPPKSFRSTGTLPLIYSEGGHLPPWPYFLHLFAPQAPIANKFEEESKLQDWHLTVPVLGIVVIFDKKHDALPPSLSFSWLRGSTASKSAQNRSLVWALAQQLPIVIAALGYDDSSTFENQIRGRYAVAADIPIVPGPVLADVRRKESGGMFSLAFERQQVSLDKDYAQHVMSVLYRQITIRQEQAP
jgi:hypothetical protein